jgi:hypothetical protein
MDDAGKIRIWEMVAQSYRFVLSHPRDLARVGWLPLIALFALNLLFDGAGTAANAIDPAVLGPAVGKAAVNLLVLSLIAAMILVAWHRVVLLGDGGRRGMAVGLGPREMRYLLSWLALSAAFLVLFVMAWALVIAAGFTFLVALKLALLLAGAGGTLALGNTDQFLALLYVAVLPAFLLASYFATRLSLVLPAMATDRQRSLGRAWSLSAGNGWRLVLAALLVMLPVELVSFAIGFAMREMLDTALYYPLALAASCGVLLLIVATGTVLSLFSVELDQRGGPATPAPRAVTHRPAVA